MIVIIILLILGLAGFCMLASGDLLHKTELTWHSWVLVIFMVGAIIGCLFIGVDWIRTESIKDYTDGKYRLEEVVYSDTTFVVKRKK